ncbi:MAG: thioesterase family protein [Pseudomonadota bacterium]
MSDAAALPGIDAYDAAPLATPPREVPQDWIDYNGHMNVAYYTMAFDKSSDIVFDEMLGIGEELARTRRMGPMIVQQQIQYIGELLQGESFYCELQLLDWSPKSVHFFSRMLNAADGSLCATSESLSLNVDLDARRTAPYPDWALRRIEALGQAHRALPRPEQAGAVIGIRRKA